VLTQNGTIFYKNYKTNFLSEDQSLSKKAQLKGCAVTISPDGLYLAVGYEVNWEGKREDHLALRVKQDNGFYAPFTFAVVDDQEGTLFFDVFRIWD
jgi:hypothetical protein